MDCPVGAGDLRRRVCFRFIPRSLYFIAFTAVYVTDYGIHSSVIMPNGDGRFVEYAFGDWNYAALNHDWPNDAMGQHADFIQIDVRAQPSSWLEYPGETEPHPTHPTPKRTQVIYASYDAVEAVRQQLDDRYRHDMSQTTTRVVHNHENEMDFVPDDEHYSFLNNCNDLTARCLRNIGCDLKGVVGFSKFQGANVKQHLVGEPTLACAAPREAPTARAD